jgi:hypothetical protein
MTFAGPTCLALAACCALSAALAQDQPAARAGDETPEHPLKPAIALAASSLKTLEEIQDYEASMIKRELIDGKMITQSMTIKFREEPFSVYLGFTGENAGREVLYIDGKNQNMILAHEGSGLKSLVGTISLSPTGKEVMAQNRYPITTIGLRNILRKLSQRWEDESKYGECDVKFYQNAKLGETACLVVECSHPRPRKQFKFHLTRLFIDKQTNLPVRVENFDHPPRDGEKPVLLEEYTYLNLRTNLGLTDRDFDRNNPNYAF